MKKMLKLNELNKQDMKKINGGDIPGGNGGVVGNCQCGCHYENSGGSSSTMNLGYNWNRGLRSDSPK